MEEPPREPSPEEIEIRKLRDILGDKMEALSKKLRMHRGPMAEEELMPEKMEAEIGKLQGEMYDRCAGENFDKLSPDLQQGFLDIDDAITYTPDRKRLLEAMRLFLELLPEDKKETTS